MSGANKFRFVSPGIQIREIDRSQINNLNDAVGPTIIGRARRGPGMVPVKVRSYEEFVQIFGEPVRGSTDGDMWREGNLTAPTLENQVEFFLQGIFNLISINLVVNKKGSKTNVI